MTSLAEGEEKVEKCESLSHAVLLGSGPAGRDAVQSELFELRSAANGLQDNIRQAQVIIQLYDLRDSSGDSFDQEKCTFYLIGISLFILSFLSANCCKKLLRRSYQ